MKKKFSIGLVYYSGEKFLSPCIKTLLGQSEQNFEILFRDHSENFSGKIFLEKFFPEEVKNEKIKIFTGKNLWHSGGHNFLTNKMSGDIYICGSIDMKYTKKFLADISYFFKKNTTVGICTGKILQWGSEKFLDSAGIEGNNWGRFWDRGQGEREDEKKFCSEEEIFGASGALFAIRKKIIPKHGLFEEKIFYKNDVYLMHLLQKNGEKCFFIPKIFAWHHRQVGKNSQKNFSILQSSFEGQYWIWKKFYTKKNFARFFVFAQFMRLFCNSPQTAIKSLRKITTS